MTDVELLKRYNTLANELGERGREELAVAKEAHAKGNFMDANFHSGQSIAYSASSTLLCQLAITNVRSLL